MCGIAGELLLGDVSSGADWNKISAMMARRGPDDSGFWSDNGRCNLIFRRLAILDLSPSGHQPMTAGEGRYALVFNGEVYNFAELRGTLQTKGVTFRSHGDSEVVLHALIHWGAEALDKFNGMFALAFYDRLEQRLLLARDHAGIKPLYYMHRPQGVVFASQYDQLLAHPWSRNLAISQEALGLYLRLAHIPAPYAILQDTFMLEAGTWIEFKTSGQMRTGRYFTFPKYQPPVLSGQEAFDAIDSTITAAIKRQLVSDVPVGAFLSGGIDSPLVVAKMCAAGSTGVHAFTIGTGGDVSDESEDAKAYAKELAVQHTVEQVTPDMALGMLDDVLGSCSEPFGDYSIFPTLMVSRLASQKYKVILSGDGGDELFWGYAKRASSLINAAEEFRHPHWLRKTRRAVNKIFGTNGISYEARKFHSLGDWQRDKHTHLPEDWLSKVFSSPPRWPEQYKAFEYTQWPAEQTAQWLRWNEFTTHLTMVLLKVDRASMHHSLEVRVPLLDREVIAVASQIDWRTCLDLRQMRGKLPLRHSLSRHVQHQTTAKRGFTVPMGAWLRGSLRHTFEDAVLTQNEILGVPVNKEAMRSLFDHHLQGRDISWWLWPLLSLALWSERHYKGRAIFENNAQTGL